MKWLNDIVNTFQDTNKEILVVAVGRVSCGAFA